MNPIKLPLAIFYDITKNHTRSVKLYRETKLNNAYVNFRIGNGLCLTGKYREAIPYLQKAVNRGISNALCYYRLGNAFYKTGILDQAASYYLKAIERRPGWLPWVEHFLKCNPNIENLTESQKNLLGSHAAEAWYSLAKVKIKSSKFYQAIPYLEKAIEANSKKGHLFYELGLCYFKIGKLELAKKTFQKALGQKFSSVELYKYLYLISKAEKNKESQEKYLKILHKLANIDIKYGCAELSKQCGDWDQVYEEANEFISKFPSTDSNAHYLRGMASDYILDLNTAQKDLELSISLSSKPEPYKYFRLAIICLRLGKYKAQSKPLKN